MCMNRCTTLWDACGECIEEMFQSHEDHLNHEAVLAFVPASDDEWRQRLDEEYPLVTSLTSLHFTQGTSNEQG